MNFEIKQTIDDKMYFQLRRVFLLWVRTITIPIDKHYQNLYTSESFQNTHTKNIVNFMRYRNIVHSYESRMVGKNI